MILFNIEEGCDILTIELKKKTYFVYLVTFSS